MKGKITNFVANFLASPMDGTKPHMHQISNSKSTDKRPNELIGKKTSLINGTADIKINGQTIWKDAHISVMIANSRTFILYRTTRILTIILGISQYMESLQDL